MDSTSLSAAWEQHQNGDHLTARRFAEDLLVAGNDDTEILRLLTRCALALRDQEAALRHGEELARRLPQDAAAQLLLGQAYERSERLEQAEAAYERAHALAPDNAEAARRHGDMLAASGKLEKAAQAYEASLAQDSFETRLRLGVIYAQLERLDNAVESVRAALRTQPDHAEARELLLALAGPLAERYASAGTLPELRALAAEVESFGGDSIAEPIWRFLLDAEAADDAARERLFGLLWRTGHTAQAEQLGRARLESDETPWESLSRWSSLFVTCGRADIAANALRTRLNLHADRQRAGETLATIIATHSGSTSAAITALRREIENHPDITALHLHLIDALVQAGKDGDAEQAAHSAKAVAADRGAICWRLVRIFHRQGRHADMIAEHQAALATDAAIPSDFHLPLAASGADHLVYRDPDMRAWLESGARRDNDLTRDLLDFPEKIETVLSINFWGRSGSMLLSSLFDNHPEVIQILPHHSLFDAVLLRFPKIFSQGGEGFDSIESIVDTILNAFEKSVLNGSSWSALPEERAGAFSEALHYGIARLMSRRMFNPGSLFRLIHVAWALAYGTTYARVPIIIFQTHQGYRHFRQLLVQYVPGIRFLLNARYPPRTYDSHLHHHFYHNPIADPFELAHLLASWLIEMGAWYDGIDRPGGSYVVRFEDVHNHPETVMRWLANWLGISWHPCLLESTSRGKPWGMAGVAGHVSGTRKMKPKDFALQVLSLADAAKIRGVFRENMRQWRYETPREAGFWEAPGRDIWFDRLLARPFLLHQVAFRQAIEQGMDVGITLNRRRQADSALTQLFRQELARRQSEGCRLLPLAPIPEMEALGYAYR